MWNQIYDPLNNTVLSTIAAALPVVTLLVLIASGKVKAHIAAVIALIVANIITIFIYSMPTAMSVKASLLGVVVGFFPIGWIVLNVIFLYRVTVETGRFELLKRAIGGVTEDRRLQLLLIAFAFGAFFEGASGFGTPVAITGAVLIGLGVGVGQAASDAADDEHGQFLGQNAALGRQLVGKLPFELGIAGDEVIAPRANHARQVHLHVVDG